MRLNNNQIVAICRGIKALTTPETKYYTGPARDAEICRNVTFPSEMATGFYQPHCLIGFILLFAGQDLSEANCGTIVNTAKVISLNLAKNTLEILSEAQHRQDRGATWHTCIDYIIESLS